MLDSTTAWTLLNAKNLCETSRLPLTLRLPPKSRSGGQELISGSEKQTREYMNSHVTYFFKLARIDCLYSESRLMLSPVNVIIRLMWSHFKIGMSQSDHIKRLLLNLYLADIESVNIFCHFDFPQSAKILNCR